MRLISSHDDLAANIRTIEATLHGDDPAAREVLVGLIKRGTYFVVAEISGAMRFYPVSFVGFRDNSAERHQQNAGSGVRATSRAIEKVLRAQPIVSTKLNDLYQEYARTLGIENPGAKPPYSKQRRFWLTPGSSIGLDVRQLADPAADEHPDFPEGKAAARLHRRLDRRRRPTETARYDYTHAHGHLACQVCGFDFEQTYGALGADFIELHHTVPIDKIDAGYRPKAEEYAVVCANCHRMLHRHRPWLTLENLGQLLPGGRSDESD